MANKKNKPIEKTPNLVLSDTDKKLQKQSSKNKRTGLAGKAFDSLKANEKDALIKSLLESEGYIDSTGIVL